MNLLNWLRNLEQKIYGRQHRRLRRRPVCGYSTIAAEIQTLESRQLLSAAGPAVLAQASNPGLAPDLLSHASLSFGNMAATVPTPINTTSDNWSGYVATNNVMNSVTWVSGSWTVPTVAPSTGNSYSCAWVGIDGWLGNTVEQIGTEQDMVNGTPVYYAWWEMWSNGVRQPQQAFAVVSPGDSVSAQVQFITTGAHAGQFQLSFTDWTRPTSNFTTYQTSSATQYPLAPRSQAEWVVEATMENGSVAQLANFGKVTFSNALATINGVTQPISGPYSSSARAVNVYQINMVQEGVTVDSTSSLTTGQNGSSFTVSYLPQAPAVNLSGTWFINGKQTTIAQTGSTLTFTNENGGTSAGVFISTTQIEATGWGRLVGTLDNSNQTLAWANGSVWTRSPTVNLAGTWLINGKQTTIAQTGSTLTFTNENGGTSAGLVISATQVEATGWGKLVGTLGNSNQTLSWSNGSVWTKAPTVNLSGTWLINGKQTTIVQTGLTLTFTNENGGTSAGLFISTTQVEATVWGKLVGTLGNNNQTLAWANGSVWVRS